MDVLDQELRELRDGEDGDEVEEQLECRDGLPRQIVEGAGVADMRRVERSVGLTVALLTSDCYGSPKTGTKVYGLREKRRKTGGSCAVGFLARFGIWDCKTRLMTRRGRVAIVREGDSARKRACVADLHRSHRQYRPEKAACTRWSVEKFDQPKVARGLQLRHASLKASRAPSEAYVPAVEPLARCRDFRASAKTRITSY